jgi:integrase
MQFTDKLIKSLKPKNVPYDLREGSGQGFGIRVMPSTHKSWIFIYYFEGKKKRMTLGAYPAISLADARKLHRDAISCLASGKSPAAEQQKARVEAIVAGTVNELVDEYLEKWAKPRKRSWKEDERILKKDVVPAIGKLKAKNITKRDIILILDRVLDRGSPIAANRTLAVVRRMFNFAVERDIIEITPCYGVKLPSKENRKDRVLSMEEIKSFWHGLENASMLEMTKIVLKLQLVTAQRKAEIVKAEWDEFDLKSGWWTIPAAKAKNGNQHRVPLSDLALDLLSKLKELTGGSKWLFPSPKGNTHMAPGAVDHALRKNLDKFENVKPFTPHDLRRSSASHMTALGVLRLVVSKILNHTESSVTSIYDRHSYDKEKKEAVHIWNKKLQEIILNNDSITNP